MLKHQTAPRTKNSSAVQERQLIEMMGLSIKVRFSDFRLLWADNIARAEADERQSVVESFLHYDAILGKFTSFCSASYHKTLKEENLLTKEELSDLADALADSTLYMNTKTAKEEVQWLIEQLSNIKTL
ncbi:hypothetical protein [Bergeyella zoohelcum]|uniref:Uncharacterized protein n=1 Tax=Bergeyella zoohelcum TaxID=1015 RepID=A0A376BZQ1_9FLAO|nr:hypothetical protein [Bergeyella zoohelcum]EKB60787.1 hypothetical protein HMPREF9700_00282 [Bergeyella zoohelcum CCUG 30536]SSZ47122.1 Uncharacterised protein [Bergeyella zoohelcum]